MRFDSAIDHYLDALANVRLALRSPSTLIPFLIFGVVQALILSALAFFTVPALAGLMVPFVRALGGEAALHYPTSFVLLPATYRLVYLPLVATVGFALWSFGVWSMISHHDVGARTGTRSFRRALPNILAIGLVFVAVTVAAGRGLALLAAELPAGIPSKLATVGIIAVTACAQALLIYAPAILRLRGGSAITALRTSARYAQRMFIPTALVIATVLLVHLPADALIGNADVLAARFRPEIVFHLMVGSIVLEIVTAFLLFAGVVALALPEEGGLR
ncbi:MAG TPA: hypothetical protein VFU38_00120 [Candidatus Krumholzibacteria bacterium]|nr:hypothetical protein [Candidatus Krumholzibacteria bacterium]